MSARVYFHAINSKVNLGILQNVVLCSVTFLQDKQWRRTSVLCLLMYNSIQSKCTVFVYVQQYTIKGYCVCLCTTVYNQNINKQILNSSKWNMSGSQLSYIVLVGIIMLNYSTSRHHDAK